jgi:hypothetical protein
VTLQIIDGGGEDPDDDRRILAPGAPPSAGAIPNALAAHLRHGEVLAWWGSKESIQWGPIALTAGAAVLVLGMASAFAPGLWSGGWSAMWAPLLALASPTLFVLVREWLGRGSVLVTDEAVVEVDMNGQAHRLALAAIVRVRRDWVRGGVKLEGPRAQLRIPPQLVDETRDAIASRLRGRVRSTVPDDPVGFLPQADGKHAR